MKLARTYTAFLILLCALVVTALVYRPGLGGPWLVDDQYNLGMFNDYAQGQAPYRDIIFNNPSGPLGRPVSMASFAANHALGLFSDTALKSTNLLIHLGNGVLLYFLLQTLFRRRHIAEHPAPEVLSAIATAWWLVLPMHISTTLYIVQRMALLSTTFSLATLLLYAAARSAQDQGRRRAGIAMLAASLLATLPLAVLAKESAFCVPALLILVEVYFFQESTLARAKLPRLLTFLVAATVLFGAALVLVFPIGDSYVWRDFSLPERLMTEARVMWSYIGDILLPASSQVGLAHDDYAISRRLLQPWTTLPALVALAALLITAIRTASSRWWAASFGVLFYLAGHLIESTIVSLEIYFEHRNYLPSVGLIIAAGSITLHLPEKRQKLLAIGLLCYLLLLAFCSLQRSETWGEKHLLLASSALSHPQSLRAWTDYAEDLVSQRQGQKALEASLQAANNNPAAAGVFYMQMASIYCRGDQPPPATLIHAMADGMEAQPYDMPSLLTPMSIGLDYILTLKSQGHCQNADFSPLAPALLAEDDYIRKRFGAGRKNLWLMRMTMAEWLLQLGHVPEALKMLRDTWAQDNKDAMPMVGLTLAKALSQHGDTAELVATLDQLSAVTRDAPADFRAEMNALEATTGRKQK